MGYDMDEDMCEKTDGDTNQEMEQDRVFNMEEDMAENTDRDANQDTQQELDQRMGQNVDSATGLRCGVGHG